jgi:hypothetical protein
METDMNRITAALLGLAAGTASAGQLSLHEELGSFLAAAGPDVALQDFEAFAALPNVNGLELLPGVTMSSNTSAVQVRVRDDGAAVRATFEGLPEMWLDTHLPAGSTAVAFDIRFIDGGTGPGLISVFFAPGTPGLSQLDIPVPARSDDNQTSRDQFFGITGDLPIARVRYAYGLETNGQCCEEILYDNLRVLTAPVPEPASVAMMLAGCAWLARRRWSARSV